MWDINNGYDDRALVGMHIRSFTKLFTRQNPFDKKNKLFCSEACSRAFRDTGHLLPSAQPCNAFYPAEFSLLTEKGTFRDIYAN